jgi:MFS family permease
VYAFLTCRYGGKSDVVWLGLYNACLLVGVLVGYTVGAVATVDSTLGWQYYYGLQAVLMLLCGIMYCFIDPALIQVSDNTRERKRYTHESLAFNLQQN